MKEIIKVDFETQMVSAKEIHEALEIFDNFKDYFIEVSKMKADMEFEELKILRRVVKNFSCKFGAEAIAYLTDSIDAEMVLPIKSMEARKENEKKMKEEVVNNFNSIFPYYTFVECEKRVDGIGRIDIYAICGEKSVIIELKTGRKNPNPQLVAYGSKFKEPILIGITEEELNDNQKIDGVFYFTLSELKERVEQWVI